MSSVVIEREVLLGSVFSSMFDIVALIFPVSNNYRIQLELY